MLRRRRVPPRRAAAAVRRSHSCRDGALAKAWARLYREWAVATDYRRGSLVSRCGQTRRFVAIHWRVNEAKAERDDPRSAPGSGVPAVRSESFLQQALVRTDRLVPE